MIQFKQPGAAEIPSLLGLVQSYYQFDHLPFDACKAKAGLEQLMADPKLGEVWLVTDQGKIIGYVILAFSFTLEFGGREAFVDELFIEEKFRGGGIGTKTLEHVFDRCSKNGIQALRLEVTRGNSNALELYQKLGFQDLNRYLLTREMNP